MGKDEEFKPRVVRNYNNHIGIEIKRGRKWAEFVTREAEGLKRNKMLISQVDRYWDTYDYDIKKAIEKFIAPHSLTKQVEDNSIVDELKALLKGLK